MYAFLTLNSMVPTLKIVNKIVYIQYKYSECIVLTANQQLYLRLVWFDL